MYSSSVSGAIPSLPAMLNKFLARDTMPLGYNTHFVSSLLIIHRLALRAVQAAWLLEANYRDWKAVKILPRLSTSCSQLLTDDSHCDKLFSISCRDRLRQLSQSILKSTCELQYRIAYCRIFPYSERAARSHVAKWYLQEPGPTQGTAALATI